MADKNKHKFAEGMLKGVIDTINEKTELKKKQLDWERDLTEYKIKTKYKQEMDIQAKKEQAKIMTPFDQVMAKRHQYENPDIDFSGIPGFDSQTKGADPATAGQEPQATSVGGIREDMPQGPIEGGVGGSQMGDKPQYGGATWSPVESSLDPGSIPETKSKVTSSGFSERKVDMPRAMYGAIQTLKKRRQLNAKEQMLEKKLEEKLGFTGKEQKTTEGKRKVVGAVRGLISKNASLEDINEFIAVSGYEPEDFQEELQDYSLVDKATWLEKVSGRQKYDKRVKDGVTYEKREDNLWHPLDKQS